MNFNKIRLSWFEMLVLRLSVFSRVPDRLCRRLLRLGLVDEIRSLPSPGAMPVPTGFSRISHKGEDYLAYSRSESKRYWIPVLISLVSLIVSIIALIASLSPVQK